VDALSASHRRALAQLVKGSAMRRAGRAYVLVGHPDGYPLRVCGNLTARQLFAQQLIAPAGPSGDPNAQYVLTERGKLVVNAAD
jgi:hypothetical protein